MTRAACPRAGGGAISAASRAEERGVRGYFAIGVEGVTKSMNVGALMRTAHAFGASFVFTIAANYARDEGRLADTSDAPGSMPFYEFGSVDDFALPRDCELVGVELMDDAVELPSFRHPRAAAYVMGPERGSLSPELVARCAHVVKIPTRFSINLSLAGALVMYDRLVSRGRFPARPVAPGGPVEPLARHAFAPPKIRRPRVSATGTD
jgi:tRNA G18 (ribose-2'-O)-methylase SpoU